MSRQFQLNLIRSSLDDLGLGNVARQLDDPEISGGSGAGLSLFPQTLRSHIDNGTYTSLIDQINTILHAPNDNDLALSAREFFTSTSSDPDDGSFVRSMAILVYLIRRFDLIEKVVIKSFEQDPGPDQALVDELRTLVDSLHPIVALDAQCPMFDLSLLQKLDPGLETDVLLPLVMLARLDVYEIDHLVSKPAVFLVDDINTILFKVSFDHDIKTYYLSRLRLGLLHLLFKNHLPSLGSAVQFPKHYLADVIDRARRYSTLQLLYHLPERSYSKSKFEQELSEEIILSQNREDDFKNQFPSKLLHELKEHSDEVWFAKFSPLGHFLVTGSLDGTLVIYDVVDNFKTLAILDSNFVDYSDAFVPMSYKPPSDRKKGIIYCCWDPNEKYLVACSFDTVVRVWSISDITTKNKRITRSMDDSRKFKLLCCFTLGQDIRTWSCEFLPQKPNMKPHFVIGSPDKKLKVFTIDGEELFDFYSVTDEMTDAIEIDNNRSTSSTALRRSSSSVMDRPESVTEAKDRMQFNRINDLAITPDGKLLITVNHEKQVMFYTIPDLLDPNSTTTRLATINLNGRLTSCSVSRSGKYLLVNIAPEELQIWDISQLQGFPSNPSNNVFSSLLHYQMRPPLLKLKLFGHTQNNYIVRSSFGYVNTQSGDEELVITGSDSGYVYFWKAASGLLITRVKAHNGLCNSVDWNRNFACPSPTSGNSVDYGKYWCSAGDDNLVKIWGPPEA